MKHLGIVFVLNLNYMVTYIAYSVYPPYFPENAHKKGVDEQTVSIIMTPFYVTYAAVAISMGTIIKSLGRKRTTLLGLVLLSLNFVMVALANRIETKMNYVIANIALRSIHGASQALVQVTTYSIVASVFPNEIAK